MRFTVDRFEGEFAVVELENRDMLDIPKILLPKDTEEGDILIIVRDDYETRERNKRIEKKFKRIFKD